MARADALLREAEAHIYECGVCRLGARCGVWGSLLHEARGELEHEGDN